MVGCAWKWFGALLVGVGVSGALVPLPALGDPVRPSTTTTVAAPTDEGGASSPTAGRGGRWVTISGRGFGHGVGMAQDGAYWMGRQGRSSAEILRHFYPGTALGSRGGSVRVPLGGAGVVTLTLADGGSVDGRRIAPGGTVTVRSDGGELIATIATQSPQPSDDATDGSSTAPALAMTPIAFRTQSPSVLEPTTSAPTPVVAPVAAPAIVPPAPTTTEPPPVTTTPVTTTPATPPSAVSGDPAREPQVPEPPVTPPASVESPVEQTPTTSTGPESTSPAVREDTVRGNPLVVAAAPGGTVTYGGRRYRGSFDLRAQGGVRVVNELDVEQYLRGMGEVTDPRWPAAALEAQAIAARTYAFRTMASAGEVCPTQRCQVYVGVKAEYGAMDKAVAATRGKVVTYSKGKLAVTFYSASGGGTIATPEEAFGGSGDFPYLQAGTYPTGDLKSWVVTMSIDEVGRRVGYGGTASRVTVTKVGPSGRAVEVTVSGSGTPLVVPGPRFDSALGLRSTLFTLEQSDTRPRDSSGTDEVLTDSSPAAGDVSPSSGASSEPLVFSQTGIFEAPAREEDTSATDPSPQTNADQPSPIVEPSIAEEPSIADETPPSNDPPTGTRRANSSAVAKLATGSQTPNRATEIAFLGALTITATTVLAATRRWRRSRRR